VSERQSYVVVDSSDEAREAASICGAVFDLLGESAVTAHVDAYSDFDDQMPDDIREAQQWLRGRGLARGSGDPGMAIVIEQHDETGWVIARAYAPWSIHTSLYDADGVNLATLHDGGQSVTVNLNDAQARELTEQMAPHRSLAPLGDPQ
jgi:hypothetical protein